MPQTDDKATATASWLDSIGYVIEEFADRDIQDRRWFGRNPPEESSPTELICMLLDSLHFDNEYKNPALDLTNTQREACAQFAKMVEIFAHRHRDHLNEHEVIDDPDWQKIRMAAANLLKVLPS